MSGKLRRWCVPLGVVVALATATPAMADGVEPIGPNQAYIGQVNGSSTSARILVDCDNPTGPNPTGHPVAGQPVKAERVHIIEDRARTGFTGTSPKTIGVSFADTHAVGPLVSLRAFGEVATIPTNVIVPCHGTGTVVFAADPASATSQPATVPVTFARF